MRSLLISLLFLMISSILNGQSQSISTELRFLTEEVELFPELRTNSDQKLRGTIELILTDTAGLKEIHFSTLKSGASDTLFGLKTTFKPSANIHDKVYYTVLPGRTILSTSIGEFIATEKDLLSCKACLSYQNSILDTCIVNP